MGDSPAVSVVMTAYNIAPYIGAAIESALAQTFRDFELLVMDDGSMDGTLRIAERFLDPRLRVMRSPHLGAATQLRDGFEQARAPVSLAVGWRRSVEPKQIGAALAISQRAAARRPHLFLVTHY